MPEIIIIDTRNPQETKTIQLSPEDQINQECLIGRDSRCSIVLNDNLASRTHGKIVFRNGSHFYCDLGSRNGSKINNENVQLKQEYLLKSSDTIALGNHLLWVKAITGEETTFSPQFLAPEQYMPLATMDIASLETWSQGTKQVKCVQIINETVDVKTFSFVCDPPVKFAYQPGQFLTLNLNIDGKNIKHSYSVSSAPSRPHTIEITVKRFPLLENESGNLPGLVCNWLHDNLKVGNQIEVSAPAGKFTNFVNPSPKLLLISAGSGIAPMMSMSRWICDTVSNVDLVFLHSASSPEDIIFRQELEMMTSRYPNFKLAVTVTRPTVGQSWYGYTGRINETILPAIASDYQDRTVYVCGSHLFMADTKELLQKLSFPMENYYEENFEENYCEAQKKPQSEPPKQFADQTSIFPTTPPPLTRSTSATPHPTSAPSAPTSPPPFDSYPPSETVMTVPATFIVDSSTPSTSATSTTFVTHIAVPDKSSHKVPGDGDNTNSQN
ncbi:MAG: FHA domain-containing protein [Waterburya sp.]